MLDKNLYLFSVIKEKHYFSMSASSATERSFYCGEKLILCLENKKLYE